MNYTLNLLEKRKINDTLTTFIFAKPTPFLFKPGQFILVSFNSDFSDPHAFSISSSPEDQFLEITVRKVGPFTTRMNESSPGAQFYISGPYGNFTLDQSKEEAVLIAGGVGVCPFLSMIKHSNSINSERKITLIFSAKIEKDFVNEELLDKISKENKNIKINYLTDFIDKNFLLKAIKDIKDKSFYICGPPEMIPPLKKILKSLKVNESDIHVENWGSVKKVEKVAKIEAKKL